MFQPDHDPERLLRLPMPPRYRLAAALARKAAHWLEQNRKGEGAPRDPVEAARLLRAIPGPLDDSSDADALDDALERAVDALSADHASQDALETAARALLQHGQIEDWVFHPRPLQDARKLLRYARDDGAHPGLLELRLFCDLLLGRFESAGQMLADLKTSGDQPWVHAVAQGLWFDLHDNFSQAAEWFAVAADKASDPERKSWSLIWLARALANQGDLAKADERMAEAVLAGRPHRQRLLHWSNLKFHRRRYDEAWELNRRALTFGRFDDGLWARQFLLQFFRRLGFVPAVGFLLPEEQAAGAGDASRGCGDNPDTGDWPAAELGEDIVPVFRTSLLLDGEHLPPVEAIADPSAGFEGRARLHVYRLDAAGGGRKPVEAGVRFQPGRYLLEDAKSGFSCEAHFSRRLERRNPYDDLPETWHKFLRLDENAVRRLRDADWEVALSLCSHGFDTLQGVLAQCKLVDSFLRHAGGTGIDLETGLPVHGGDWRNEGPQAFDISRHIVIRIEEAGSGAVHLRTCGLCKFLRPELVLRNLAEDMVEGAWNLLMNAAEEAARGAPVDPGRLVGEARRPLQVRRLKAQEEGPVYLRRPAVELVDPAQGVEASTSTSAQGVEALLRAENRPGTDDQG